jgi:DNA mismatch repair protein MutS
VEELRDQVLPREELRELFGSVLDLERIMARIIYGTANSRDLAALCASIRHFPRLKDLLGEFHAPLLSEIHTNFDALTDLYQWIDQAIEDDPPFSVREGGFIKDGYNAELDSLRAAKSGGADWLTALEAEERKRTGIKNLKIRFSRVFGYCIEITNSHKHLAPERYIRRQTLSNCERYVTEELKKIEETILGADEKIVALEYKLFTELRGKIADQAERVKLTAMMIGAADALQSFGDAADRFHYCKPALGGSGAIEIRGGRHPVVEQWMDQPFVPNDTFLDLEENRLAIITGPNMAGKSTYMRQTALIVLMAQAGSFVPADSARISVVDRIFTRVGAADDLATGQSTFMVEMSEVANILNNASRNSLIILDEIGRGTSTFDGLSIAWAVLEHIADETRIGAKTLFATHYHELTELEGKVAGVKNYCVAVRERGEEILFLRKIERGGADHSYGVHVARLAGLPTSVLARSREILDALNSADIVKTKKTKVREHDRVHDRIRDRIPQKQSAHNQLFLPDFMDDAAEVDVNSQKFDNSDGREDTHSSPA